MKTKDRIAYFYDGIPSLYVFSVHDSRSGDRSREAHIFGSYRHEILPFPKILFVCKRQIIGSCEVFLDVNSCPSFGQLIRAPATLSEVVHGSYAMRLKDASFLAESISLLIHVFMVEKWEPVHVF